MATLRNVSPRSAGPRFAYEARMRQRLAIIVLPALAVAAVASGCDDGTTPTPPPPACESGLICTWAGNGEPAFYGDGLDRREATLYWPIDLDFAPGRARLRARLAEPPRPPRERRRHASRPSSAPTTWATARATGDERTPPGGPGTDGTLNHPTDLASRPTGRVLLAAWHNHKIRRLRPHHRHGRRGLRQGPGVRGRRDAGDWARC